MQQTRAVHGKINRTPRAEPFSGLPDAPSAQEREAARWQLDTESGRGPWPADKAAQLFEAFLVMNGGIVTFSANESYRQGYAQSDRFKFRYTCDRIEIGVLKTFDRWANSVDFVCTPVPSSESQCEAVMLAAEEAVSRGLRDGLSCWEPYDLYSLVRKHRNSLKARQKGRI